MRLRNVDDAMDEAVAAGGTARVTIAAGTGRFTVSERLVPGRGPVELGEAFDAAWDQLTKGSEDRILLIPNSDKTKDEVAVVSIWRGAAKSGFGDVRGLVLSMHSRDLLRPSGRVQFAAKLGRGWRFVGSVEPE